MGIDTRVRQLDERQARQRLQRILGGEIAGSHALHQLAQTLAVQEAPLTADGVSLRVRRGAPRTAARRQRRRTSIVRRSGRRGVHGYRRRRTLRGAARSPGARPLFRDLRGDPRGVPPRGPAGGSGPPPRQALLRLDGHARPGARTGRQGQRGHPLPHARRRAGADPHPGWSGHLPAPGSPSLLRGSCSSCGGCATWPARCATRIGRS